MNRKQTHVLAFAIEMISLVVQVEERDIVHALIGIAWNEELAGMILNELED